MMNNEYNVHMSILKSVFVAEGTNHKHIYGA